MDISIAIGTALAGLLGILSAIKIQEQKLKAKPIPVKKQTDRRPNRRKA